MIFGREPALWIGLIQAVLALGIGFGLKLTGEQIALVLAASTAVFAFITRSQVVPVKTLKENSIDPKSLAALFLVVSIGIGAASCANKTTPLASAQVSHDSLALAQDLEAQLCWGVAVVTAPVPNRSHCTTTVAATIGLTDARHQSINGKLMQAFTLHGVLTKQLRQGITVDLSSLRELINTIVGELTALQQTSDVMHLINSVKAGEIK